MSDEPVSKENWSLNSSLYINSRMSNVFLFTTAQLRRHVPFDYQSLTSSTFLSEQTSHQQSASSTFLSE
jgi:hypothetical protein